ncbi:MAG: methylmalonyl-CoA mutase family protein, partial [Pseudomonadota bacterium]
MSDPSTDLMSHTFPPSSQEDWRALAEKALKGAPLSGLFAKTADDIEIAPLYADGRPVAPVAPGADDANARPASTSPPTETGRVDAWSAATRALCIPRDGATPWDIRALHGGTDAGDVNAAILDDLAGGASSICLQMAAPGQHGLGGTYAAMDAALAGAHLDMIHTSVLAGDQYVGAALALEALWDARGCKAGGRRGAVNADPIGHLARTGELEDKLFDTLRTLAHFVATNHAGWPDCTLMLADARPYFEAGASEAQELAAMVATLVSYLRLGDEDGIAPYKVLPKIAVALAADADIFLSLAKLRAARRLIARIAETAGAEAFATTVPFWVQTGERMMSSLDPHTNMLRTTAAAAAAVFAGADAVTVLPFDWPTAEDARMPRRIARNTQIMLAEESHLGRVADPAAGSGYIERLTDALCHAAWERFQAFE